MLWKLLNICIAIEEIRNQFVMSYTASAWLVCFAKCIVRYCYWIIIYLNIRLALSLWRILAQQKQQKKRCRKI